MNLQEVAQRALDRSLMRGSFRMICGRCTRQQYFAALSRQLGEEMARLAGWSYAPSPRPGREGFELCPACVKEYLG